MSRPVICVLTSATDPPPDLSSLTGRASIVFCRPDSLADRLGDAEILLWWDFFSDALRAAWGSAQEVRWIHVPAAGVDTLLFDELITSEVVVTNARGIFDRPIAEYVLGAVLAQAKHSYESRRLQLEQSWQHRETAPVTGQRALIVGTGSIGREIARLLRAVGMQVIGAGRRARSADPDFGDVIASDHLADHVGEIDQLIMVTPLTPATRRLIDARVLARMKPTAHLINVGRGPCVDTEALVESLAHGELAAATLDVVDPEPLPAGHPLWTMPQVVITPHLSGDAEGWRERLAAQFCANAERYLDGQPLFNVIDKRLGFAAP